MGTLQRCMELLRRHRVPYVHTIHPNAFRAREVASAEHLPPYKLAKTVIFCGDGVYAMVVIPADCVVDLDGLAARIGVNDIRLAAENEIARLFPHAELGTMPPLGKLFNLVVYVDERLSEEKHIVFSAGTHRDAIHMSFADYIRMENPMIGRFARPEKRTAPCPTA